ncbi:MAG: LON peptidase substrate-binding domain-containing protein [Rhodospirillales bacterium]|jgi:hypothetical protein|nr:LON peptidase substrate-binding domain-containing protein [Rhodospirillales bacterium]
MSGSVISFAETPPAITPIFPLPGVLLLPRGRLPLVLFEPRYVNMALDALGNRRVIGMVQTKGTAPHPVADDAPVHDIGCAGRITQYSETDDGRLLITLTGVSRFRIDREVDPVRGYRRVEADFGPFAGDGEEGKGVLADRPRLIDALRAYFRVKELDADWEAIEKTDDEALVTSLAMICPLAAEEKQALLETDGFGARAELLTGLIEMAVLEGGGSATDARH